MKKLYLFAGILVSALFSVTTNFAQSLPVGIPVIEDAYRREQLLGKVDSSVSFTIRPLFPAAMFKKTNIFDRIIV